MYNSFFASVGSYVLSSKYLENKDFGIAIYNLENLNKTAGALQAFNQENIANQNTLTYAHILKKSSGERLDNNSIIISDVRYSRGPKGYFVALEKNSNKFYLYDIDAELTYTLACEGNLVNRSNSPIRGNDISALVLADVFGKNYEQLVAVQKNIAYGYVWDLNITNPGCAGNQRYVPSADSYLSANSEINTSLANGMSYILPGYFSLQNNESLVVLDKNTSKLYELAVSENQNFYTIKQRIFSSTISDIIYAVSTKINQETGTPGKNAILFLHGNSYAIEDIDGNILQNGNVNPSNISGNQKKKIVFSVDQGWPNGLVQQMAQDPDKATQEIKRMSDGIKKLSNLYDVSIILSPISINKDALDKVILEFTKQDVSFVFDMYSSDVASFNDFTSHPDFQNVVTAEDPQNGVALKICGKRQQDFDTNKECVEYYKNKYPNYFKGLRIFEVSYFVNHSNITVDNLPPHYGVNPGSNLIPYNQFLEKLSKSELKQKEIVTSVLKFAKKNDMFVIWSDPAFKNQWLCYSSNNGTESRFNKVLSDFNNL